MKTNVIILLALLTAQISFAQAFIAAVNQIPLNTEARVEKTDGLIFTGEIITAVMITGALKSFTLKDSDGNKIKFIADDVKNMKVKPGFLGKLDMIAEKSSSLKEMVETDFNEIIDRECVISPKKKNKPILLQKLNPGFDDAIQIYNNPSAVETGIISNGDINITGGEDSSYIAVKSKGDPFFFRKSGYEKMIRDKLGDCKEFTNYLESQKLRFRDIAKHIYYYNNLCQ